MAGSVAPVSNEREGLLEYLAQQRHVLKVAAHGLTDEQARAVPTKSELSVGGLIKHVADTESGWIDVVLQLQASGTDDNGGVDDGGSEGGHDHYADHFRMHPDETLAGLIEAYDAVARRTGEVIAGIADLGQAVPVPKGVPWYPQDIDAWSVRWVLLHLIEETARHAGHADIIREHVDGGTGFPLLAAAEGWPATPWLQPWSPDA